MSRGEEKDERMGNTGEGRGGEGERKDESRDDDCKVKGRAREMNGEEKSNHGGRVNVTP